LNSISLNDRNQGNVELKRIKMDKTEKKILDAALKVFAERGYDGAKTKIIAKESGFTEMTLFRKFGTKENLFHTVLMVNYDRITADLVQMFSQPIDESQDLLKSLIEGVIEMEDKNFEYVKILITENHKTSEIVLTNGINNLGKFLETAAPDAGIDYKVLAFNIMAFAYFIIFNKRQGCPFVDYEEAVQEFIRYVVCCLYKFNEVS
jgi:AcrR family transcriptional regulator